MTIKRNDVHVRHGQRVARIIIFSLFPTFAVDGECTLSSAFSTLFLAIAFTVRGSVAK